VFEKSLSHDLRDALVRMDFDKATALLPQEGTLTSVDAADVLYHDVDVVFPCAVQNVITDDNVGRIRARLVVEGANGPVTDSARLALHDRGVAVIPDFIANPGGIIAAFVELTHSAGDKVAAAKSMTIAKITENVGRVADLARLHNVAPVQAGLYLALSRIFDLKTVG
jgi:glutamate dehydrogenase/leucine dehydrogenase